jgi:hypothetical protein
MKKRSSADVMRSIITLLYSSRDEITLVKDLSDLKEFTTGNRLEVEIIEKKHLAILEQLRKQARNDPDPKLTLKEYFENKCNGFLAKLNGVYIGYIWWGDSSMQSKFSDAQAAFYAKEIKLSSGETYGFDFFIVPQYRGNGYAIEFFSEFLAILRKSGYEKTFGVVIGDNLPARWIYNLVGYKELSRIKMRRVLQFFVIRKKKISFDREALV